MKKSKMLSQKSREIIENYKEEFYLLRFFLNSVFDNYKKDISLIDEVVFEIFSARSRLTSKNQYRRIKRAINGKDKKSFVALSKKEIRLFEGSKKEIDEEINDSIHDYRMAKEFGENWKEMPLERICSFQLIQFVDNFKQEEEMEKAQKKGSKNPLPLA